MITDRKQFFQKRTVNNKVDYTVFKKSPNEKNLLREVKIKYNENKRRIFPDYIKANASFGLFSKDFRELASLLKQANNMEIEIASFK